MNQKKVILVIMDGWGLGKVASADAIQHAKVPFTNSLYHQYPHTTLITCGEAVGLRAGYDSGRTGTALVHENMKPIRSYKKC